MAVVFNPRPQHPPTHGVLRSITILHGEIIQWITTEIGLLHRGTEKLIECNYYSSSLPYFDLSLLILTKCLLFLQLF